MMRFLYLFLFLTLSLPFLPAQSQSDGNQLTVYLEVPSESIVSASDLESFTDAIPAKWRVDSPDDALFSIQIMGEAVDIQECPYGDAQQYTLIRQRADVVVTITELAHGSHFVRRYEGTEPRPCPGSREFTGAVEVVRGDIDTTGSDPDLLITTLETILNGRGTLPISTATFRHDEAALTALFSTTSDHIITGDGNGTLSVWSPDELEPVLDFGVANGSPYFIRQTAAGDMVAMSEFGDTGFWSEATGEPLRELSLDVLGGVDFDISADGQKIATASLFGDCTVWDAATGDELFALVGHEDLMNSIAFSPDDQSIVTTSKDGTARVWDANTGEQRLLLHHADDHISYSSASFSPDGRIIATLNSDAVIMLWDAESGELISQMAFPGEDARLNFGEYLGLAFSADGNYLVTFGAENGLDVSIWDVASGERILILANHEAELRSAAFSPDGLKVVTASNDGTAQLWDLGFLGGS